ncbi:MAG: CBS domain-containing protein [Thermodesulfobacteriota bacterium]
MGMKDEIDKAVNWDTVGVDLDDSIRIAIEKMSAGRSAALAVKMGDEVVGVLTDTDLLMCIARGEDVDTTKAARCMTPCEIITTKRSKSPCVQIDATQTVENALGVLNLAGVHHLLVSGEDERVGLVSVVDLLKLAIA